MIFILLLCHVAGPWDAGVTGMAWHSSFTATARDLWDVMHHAFRVEMFYKNNECLIMLIHKRFHQHFNIGHHSHVTTCNPVLLWLN